MDIEDRTCAGCKWFDRGTSNIVRYTDGTCRRHPPRLIRVTQIKNQRGNDPGLQSFWPDVMRNDWCGEWVSRESNG